MGGSGQPAVENIQLCSVDSASKTTDEAVPYGSFLFRSKGIRHYPFFPAQDNNSLCAG